MALDAPSLARIVRDLFRRQGTKNPEVYWRFFFDELFKHLKDRLDLAEIQTPVEIQGNHSVGLRDELVLVGVSALAVTVTLPSSPFLGQRVTVVDANGSAASRNIVVQATSGTIEGVASQTLTVGYDSLDIVWSGFAWVQI